MTMNRALRRAMRHRARGMAAKLAATCYDFEGGVVVRVVKPEAIAALTRAFALMLRAGGKPVAIPITRGESMSFPRQYPVPANAYPWLAVGLDAGGQASYSLQIAGGDDKTLANEAARMEALSELGRICATAGLPMGPPAGSA